MATLGSVTENLTMLRDGIDAEAKCVTIVGHFQYAYGTIDGCLAVYRRRADESGTYGGWRWESSIKCPPAFYL